MEKKRFVFGLSIGMLLIAATAILLYWILNGQKEEAAQEGMLVQQTLVQTAEDDAEEAMCFWFGEAQI